VAHQGFHQRDAVLLAADRRRSGDGVRSGLASGDDARDLGRNSLRCRAVRRDDGAQPVLAATQNRVLDAHRLSPAPASALFVGKALANFLFVSAVELVLAPVFAVFYNLHPLGETWKLLLILPLGTWALVINGTFFAALSLRTRNRETLLPLVLLPISMPALLAMIQATTDVLTGEFEPTLWIKVLLAYAIVFTTACVLLFDTILNAD
jgi:heme exporter protein B